MPRLDAAADRYSSCLTALLAYARIVADTPVPGGCMFDSVRRLQFVCLYLGLAALFVAISAPVQAQTKITAGMEAHGPPQWPQYIGDELGWNKEAGIELEYVTVGGGGAQQLAGGSLNIAHSGYPDFARAALQGATERIIINDIIASPYGNFAKPAIKQIADLKGKLICIGGPNDITLIYIK